MRNTALGLGIMQICLGIFNIIGGLTGEVQILFQVINLFMSLVMFALTIVYLVNCHNKYKYHPSYKIFLSAGIFALIYFILEFTITILLGVAINTNYFFGEIDPNILFNLAQEIFERNTLGLTIIAFIALALSITSFILYWITGTKLKKEDDTNDGDLSIKNPANHENASDYFEEEMPENVH